MKKLFSNKYFVLFSLYIAQSVPMTFFSTVMPVIMRQNHFSLTSIGLLQLVKLPWILKFLWAPLVDHNTRSTRDFKKWILFSEAIYAMFIAAIAFLDLKVDFSLIIVLLVLAFVASATQDIATDAFAVLILHKKERSLGNSVQSGGSFVGTILGSGVLLVVYSRYGWQYLIFGLALFVLIALIPLVFFSQEVKKEEKVVRSVGLNDIVLFFGQKGVWRHVILLFFFYAAIVGVLAMMKPWLVDLGYNVKQIGVYSGIYGATTGFVFAFIAGFVIRKTGKKKAMRIFPGLTVLVLAYVYLLTFMPKTDFNVITALLGVWAVYGANSVLIYTVAMDSVRKGREGTDFTIQIVLVHLGSMFMAIASGKLAHTYGYKGLFLIELIIALLLFVAIPYLYTFKTNENESRQTIA